MAHAVQSAEVDHKIRFLLFEIGLFFSYKEIDSFLSQAKSNCYLKLKHAASAEALSPTSIDYKGPCPFQYLSEIKKSYIATHKAAVFWAWDRLINELEQSIINNALFYAYQHHWNQTIQNSQESSLWHWSMTQLDGPGRTKFFEHWGSIGHPYHPISHAKMGLSQREVLQYSPEFQAQFDIQWLAIHKHFALTSTHDYMAFVEKHFPRELALWQEYLYHKHLNLNAYYPLPIHPWQYKNTIQDKFKEQMDEGLIVPTQCRLKVTPTMSFRTVMPVKRLSPHIKLATGIHTTSAMRTVSPGSVHNGPRLSQVLNALLDKEGHFDNTLLIANDLAGLHAEHSQGKHLSVIFRQSPQDILTEDETSVPLATLFNHSPFSHKPLLVDIIDTLKLEPMRFFKDYCQMMLKGQLTLYLKFGIALEAHQQNTLIVFNEKGASKHINRDLGGVRIYRPLLQMQGYLISLEKGSLIGTDNYTEVRNKFIHTNLGSNIIPVINCLTAHFASLNKKLLYRELKGIILAIAEPLKDVIGTEQYHREINTILTLPWQKKSLLRMRLEPSQGEYIYCQSENPFKRYL